MQMTERQRDTIDQVKAWAFPVLTGVVSFFLVSMYNEFRSISDRIERMQVIVNELRVINRSIEKDVEFLKNDTVQLRRDLRDIQNGQK